MKSLILFSIFVVAVVHSLPVDDMSPNVRLPDGHNGYYMCYFDWQCKGGLCCSTFNSGCMGYCEPCARSHTDVDQVSPKCIEDFDCQGGFCCSSLQPGLEGDCVPCGGGKNKKEAAKKKKSSVSKKEEVDKAPKCIEDYDCQGGFCCSALQPGLEGDCVPCGGGKLSEQTSPRCQYDGDCEGGYCCVQEIPGLDGYCFPCGKHSGEKKSVRKEKEVETSFKCQYDGDCEGGYCCVQEIPGLDGYCFPCGKHSKKNAVVDFKKSAVSENDNSSRCTQDKECSEGFCCGHGGQCLECKTKSTNGCQSHFDCPGLDCCFQETYGQDGFCTDCCI